MNQIKVVIFEIIFYYCGRCENKHIYSSPYSASKMTRFVHSSIVHDFVWSTLSENWLCCSPFFVETKHVEHFKKKYKMLTINEVKLCKNLGNILISCPNFPQNINTFIKYMLSISNVSREDKYFKIMCIIVQLSDSLLVQHDIKKIETLIEIFQQHIDSSCKSKYLFILHLLGILMMIICLYITYKQISY